MSSALFLGGSAFNLCHWDTSISEVGGIVVRMLERAPFSDRASIFSGRWSRVGSTAVSAYWLSCLKWFIAPPVANCCELSDNPCRGRGSCMANPGHPASSPAEG
ncbi:hypothetical protein LZ30DRAFT_774804 [Colletotrichum cereale]|nr:hypothetical protein LZ30DRAFT_774804 [Colletotrichum cereale]